MIGVNLIAGTGDITSAATAAIGAGTLSAPSVDVIITVTGGGPMLGAGVFAAPIVNGGAVDITVTAAAATGFGVAPVSGSVTI